MNYLITGATGDLGHQTLNYLKNNIKQSNLFALARSTEKSKKLEAEGFSVRLGDYSNRDSLTDAFANIDTLFFVSGNSANRKVEHQNVIDAAKAANVQRIVYTSIVDADHSNSLLAPDHVYTENAIKESGLKYTFLRNNWYLENELPLLMTAKDTKDLVNAAPDGKVSWALKREYAEAAAKVLLDDSASKIIELSHTPKNYDDLAKALSEFLGQQVNAKLVDDNTFVATLLDAGLPKSAADFLLAVQHDINKNVLDVSSSDFEKVLGHPLTPLSEALKELL